MPSPTPVICALLSTWWQCSIVPRSFWNSRFYMMLKGLLFYGICVTSKVFSQYQVLLLSISYFHLCATFICVLLLSVSWWPTFNSACCLSASCPSIVWCNLHSAFFGSGFWRRISFPWSLKIQKYLSPKVLLMDKETSAILLSSCYHTAIPVGYIPHSTGIRGLDSMITAKSWKSQNVSAEAVTAR